MINMIQLTDYQKPNNRFISQYGEVTNRVWLVLEKNRIEKSKGRVAHIVEGKGKDKGNFALWVNDVGVDWETKKRRIKGKKSLRQLKRRVK